MSDQGLLYVTMQPSAGLSESLFHEWYNNEHGPLRLRLPQMFANGLRYRASDGEKPTYVAMYDVVDMKLLETDTYTTLRSNRSAREAETIGQVDVKRGLYHLVDSQQASSFVAAEALSDEEAEGLVLVAAGIELKDTKGAAEAYRKWFIEEHASLISKVPGWRRSRLFQSSNTFLGLHEYAKKNGLGGPEHKASINTPWRTEVFENHVEKKERRTWELFYVFGPAPRDLTSLSQIPTGSAFVSADTETTTQPGTAPIITSFVTTPDSLEIPYLLQGNPDPGAPTVAFCNSLLTSLHMWDPFVEVLCKNRPDIRVLRYNTRGRHGIPQPPVAATLDHVTDDLRTVLDALRIPKLDLLIGVSMGGATTLNFALKHPERLGKFIACDFNITSSAANTQAWKDRIALAREDDGQGIRKLATQTVSRWFHPSTMDNKAETVSWMTDMVASNNVDGFAHSCTALWDYDLKQLMNSNKVPGLFVVGEGDGKGALVKAMDGFRASLGDGTAQLRVVPNAGHLPMCEEPEAFWEAVRGFI